uniref:Protein phosphatase n=1 Tax=Hyaloperonospora arabidopsidis (strain Emoy2) TaxID=559515 RepID=M4BY58_HYAAE
MLKKTVVEENSESKTTTSNRSGGWILKVNNSIRRATPVSSSHRFQWGDQHLLQHAQGTFEYHGEDAGAVSSYFHIVADGVSSPFGRHSLVQYDGVLVSSAVLSMEVVKCVRVVLEEMTNHNREQLDQAAFEGAIVDAIRTARINCFHHRKSRVATTLAVSYFNRWTGKLLTFSLGDSKCLVVRRGAVVYETMAVLREFNVPTVVNLREQVVPKDYVVQSFVLQEGDVCLTFSDGVGDNLYKDDVTATLAAPELWDSEASGLQSVCDQLVDMAKMDEESGVCIKDLGDKEHALYPFATAAVLEYRKRTLEESKLAAGGPLDASGVDHMAVSLELMKKHDGKQIFDRHVLLRRPSRKHHYSLMQLRLMAQMQTKKPDDITLFMTRFM